MHDHHHHGHHHGHHHHHQQGSSHGEGDSVVRRIGWAFFLNLGFAILELIGGLWTNSVAILSDALHDFGDALALGIALVLEKKSMQGADQRFTYGYRRWSLLSAVVTGAILLVGTVFIWKESIERLAAPEAVHPQGMLAFAILGIVINGASLLRFRHGKSANEKMLLWHFIEDVAGWVLVFVGSLVLMLVDFPQIDSILALLISAWIGFRVFRQVLSVGSIFLQALPPGLDISLIENRLARHERIHQCHHTHLWSLDGEQHILTTHVSLKETCTMEELVELKASVRQVLRQEFGISEVTIEFELPNEDCGDPVHQRR